VHGIDVVCPEVLNVVVGRRRKKIFSSQMIKW
jgi:hypothetical protein